MVNLISTFTTLLISVISFFIMKGNNISSDQSFIISTLIFMIGLLIDCILAIFKNRKIIEIRHKKCEVNGDLINLSKSFDKINGNHETPEILQCKNKIIKQLIDLGDGIITLESRNQVYELDIKLLKHLKANNYFKSTVPTFSDENKNHFKTDNYLKYEQAILSAKRSGVNIIRIYLFEDETMLNVKEVYEHLNRLSKETVDIRYLIKNDFPGHLANRYMKIDINIFNNLASQGWPSELTEYMYTKYFPTTISEGQKIEELWEEVLNAPQIKKYVPTHK